MKKRILAYFKSENDAESAKAALQKLHVSELIVDDIPESGYKFSFVPFTQSGQSLGVGGKIDLEDREEKGETITHVLECEVTIEEYEEAIKILSEKEGYLENN